MEKRSYVFDRFTGAWASILEAGETLPTPTNLRNPDTRQRALERGRKQNEYILEALLTDLHASGWPQG